MKLHLWLENLNKLAADNPEILDYDIISAADDHSGEFQIIGNYATIGHFNKTNKYFYGDGHDFEDGEDPLENNVVCLN